MQTRLTVLLVALLATAASPSLSQTINANMLPLSHAVVTDRGCLGGYGAARLPQTVYDAQTHERIAYNISRCIGGYITGTNQITGRTWTADIQPSGVMTGRDLDGHRWRYDPKTRLFTDQTTGRSCPQSSLRQICPS